MDAIYGRSTTSFSPLIWVQGFAKSSMTPASKLEPGVQRELFRLGYKNILASVIGGLAAATLLGLTLHSMKPTPGVLVWMVCALCTNCFAWYLHFSFKRVALASLGPDPEQPSLSVLAKWRLLHTVFVVASAGVWAGASALLDISDPRANTLILVCVLAVLAFAASSHGVHNILSFILSALISVPMVLFYLRNAFTESVLPIAILFFMFGVVCVLIALNANRTVIQAIRFRLSNETLALQSAQDARRADQASRDKSNFLAAAAHDMRQPVHALQMLQGLLQQSQEPQQQQNILEQMQAATRTIGQLFDAVMELSRLESGTAKAKMEAIDLEAFLADRIGQHLPDALQKGLRLRSRICASGQGAWIGADRVLLMRLVDNLLSNALRYTQHGGVLITVRRHSARKLYLEIWDTGIGIAAKDIERVFDPYVQIDNEVRSREKGLGLGLAIVRNSAQLMGMTIDLRSRPGRGSRFRIVLGRVAAAPIAASAIGFPPPGLEAPALSGKNVLVIEDDPLVARALISVLEQWKGVVRHGICYEALSLAEWAPDLILCDQRLPGLLDGLETLDRLKASFPKAACLLQTGELSPEVAVRAQNSGYSLLIKPVTVEELGHAINQFLPTPSLD
jgi:two-component system, sensor histidine kinase